MNNKLLKTGILGSAITAICCFTPLLVWLLSTVGLSWLVAYLDLALLPLLGIFVLVTLYALLKGRS